MTLYLMKDGQQIKRVVEGTTFSIPAVDSDSAPMWVSPAIEGWSNDAGYSLVNVVDPAPPPPPEPTIEQIRSTMVVSRLQAKAILYQYGLLNTVEALMEQADPITKMAWAEAQDFRRLSPTILALQPYLKLSNGDPISDEMLDQIFIEGAALEF